jgi:hypothetical protein
VELAGFGSALKRSVFGLYQASAAILSAAVGTAAPAARGGARPDYSLRSLVSAAIGSSSVAVQLASGAFMERSGCNR